MSFHQYSWHSEAEITWISLIGWPHKTSNISYTVPGTYKSLSSNIRNDLLENHGSSGLIEVNRLAVDQRYRKTGLPEDLFLMFKTYCENNILEERPLINLILTKTIDIPLKIYPQWMTQTMKEVGKPFYYEKWILYSLFYEALFLDY